MPVTEEVRDEIVIRRDVRPPGNYQILIRDLELLVRVGVHACEEQNSQPVRFNIVLFACRGEGGLGVVDYCVVVDGIRRIAAGAHIRLVEDLAEEVAVLCLSDERVSKVSVRIEKLAAVEGAAAVGVEIDRRAIS